MDAHRNFHGFRRATPKAERASYFVFAFVFFPWNSRFFVFVGLVSFRLGFGFWFLVPASEAEGRASKLFTFFVLLSSFYFVFLFLLSMEH